MTSLPYEPKGKVSVLLDAMRRSPLDVWTSDQVAACMGITKANVVVYTQAAVKHSALHHKVESGRSFYSLKPFPAPGTPAAQKWTADMPPVGLPPPPPPRGPARSSPAPSVWPIIGQALAPTAHSVDEEDELEEEEGAAPAPARRTPAPTQTPAPTPAPTVPPAAPRPAPRAPAPAPIEVCAFDATLSAAGYLQLSGIVIDAQGSVRLSADQALQVKRLLNGSVVA